MSSSCWPFTFSVWRRLCGKVGVVLSLPTVKAKLGLVPCRSEARLSMLVSILLLA